MFLTPGWTARRVSPDYEFPCVPFIRTAMSDNFEQERTPITFRAKLSALQLKNAKILAASRKITVREFWEEAMELHISEREKCEKSGKPFHYIMVPRDAKSLPVYADEGLLEVVDQWAEKDNVQKDDAIYTAFSKNLEHWSKKFTGLES